MNLGPLESCSEVLKLKELATLCRSWWNLPAWHACWLHIGVFKAPFWFCSWILLRDIVERHLQSRSCIGRLTTTLFLMNKHTVTPRLPCGALDIHETAYGVMNFYPGLALHACEFTSFGLCMVSLNMMMSGVKALWSSSSCVRRCTSFSHRTSTCLWHGHFPFPLILLNVGLSDRLPWHSSWKCILPPDNPHILRGKAAWAAEFWRLAEEFWRGTSVKVHGVP